MTTPEGSQPSPGPSAEDRRRAACTAMASAPGLVRYAARFTRSLPDAEDAYQRAMEIALVSAPVVEPRRFRAWLHTVVRNEAIAISRARRREGPAGGEDAALTASRSVEDPLRPDAVAEWRERYRAVQDALAALTESQRICVMLKSTGASYVEIATVTGFSLRKVERSVLEGRAGLHAWESRMAAGQECDKVRPALERVADGSASRPDSRGVSRHTRHCHGCRALLRARRQSYEGLASLVPPALVIGEVAHALPADPSQALGYWDRLSGGATVKVGQAVQVALDLPGAVSAKLGAGAAAAVLAGAAGGPAVVDAVRGDRSDAAGAASTAVHRGDQVAGAVRRSVGARPLTRSSPAAAAPRAARSPRTPLSGPTLRQFAHVAALVGRGKTTARRGPAAATVPRTAPATAPASASPAPLTATAPARPPSTTALEFGP